MPQRPSGDHEDDSDPKTLPAEAPPPKIFVFDVLAQGAREILIDHKSQVYRLRVTKNGKLILNK